MGKGKGRRLLEQDFSGVCKYLPAYEINSLTLRGLEKSYWFIHCRQKLEKISFSWAFLPITQFPGDTESKPFLRAFPDSLTFCWINWHILYQIYLLHLFTQATNDFILNRVLRHQENSGHIPEWSSFWSLPICLRSPTPYPSPTPVSLPTCPDIKWWGYSESRVTVPWHPRSVPCGSLCIYTVIIFYLVDFKNIWNIWKKGLRRES